MRNQKDKMNNKKKVLRIGAAIFIAAFIMVGIISYLKVGFKKEVVGEYILLSEANALMEYVMDDNSVTRIIDETSESVEELQYSHYLEWMNTLKEKAKSIEITSDEDEFIIKAQDQSKYKQNEFAKKYGKKHRILKQDFLDFYIELYNAKYGENKLTIENSIYLGDQRQITYLDDSQLEMDQVLLLENGESHVARNEIVNKGFEYNRFYEYIMLKDENNIRYIIGKNTKDFSLTRGWVSSNLEQFLVEYMDYKIHFDVNLELYDKYEEIVDIKFQNSMMQEVVSYNDKLSGKLLAIKEDAIELEGSGEKKLASDFKVYKLYGNKENYSKEDLRIGYDFTDYILDGEEIIAALVVREENMDTIRAVVKTTDFAGIYHEKVELSVDQDITLVYGDKEEQIPKNQLITLDKKSDYFKEGRVYIRPNTLTANITLNSITRSQGIPSYKGTLEIQKKDEGLVVINEVLLEEYLYSVVPSEMPASYPIEALKAQAITARTYAYKSMLKSGLPNLGAHVDDSVSFQVYNNIKTNENTTNAVRETKGTILTYNGKLADTYYYSTSCGYSSDLEAWNTSMTEENKYLAASYIGERADKNGDSTEVINLENESTESDTAVAKTSEDMKNQDVFSQYIMSKDNNAYEKDLPYFRWIYETDLDEEILLEQLKKRYEAKPNQILTLESDGSYQEKPIKKLGKVKNIEITKRGHGGVAIEMMITGSKASYKVLTELNIRYVLTNNEKEIILNNNTNGNLSSMLPSAFLHIETIGENEVTGYRLYGGGYGHGIGMSQNGAKQMGELGKTAEEILTFFYEGVQLSLELE